MALVYMATSPSGKSYVGITSQTLVRRQQSHRSSAFRAANCKLFAAAIRKYGFDTFVWTVLHDNITRDQAAALEVLEIANHGTMAPRGYNLDMGGTRGAVGRDVPGGTRLRLSTSLKAARSPANRPEYASAVALLRAGQSTYAVATQTGISVQTLCRWAARESIELRTTYSAPPEAKESALTLMASGLSAVKASAQTGCLFKPVRVLLDEPESSLSATATRSGPAKR